MLHLCFCGERVFHVHNTAHAAAVACIKFDEFEVLRKLVVFEIFENVDNIVRCTNTFDGKDEERSWPYLLNQMNDMFEEAGLNYDLHWRILDASDYGVPQHRDRLFCIGFLEETDFLFPAPIKLEKSVMDYLDDKTPGIRHLTARERIRLMGFPDTFEQVVSDAQFSKQAGNSIVVNVMEALYKQMDITKYGVAA